MSEDVVTLPNAADIRAKLGKRSVVIVGLMGAGKSTIGKRVAQIQLQEAYRQILARFPNATWTGDIDVAPNNFVHAISRLGVRLIG